MSLAAVSLRGGSEGLHPSELSSPWCGGNGALNNNVYALAVSGSDLFVGGAFQNAAGIPQADRVARWSSGAWSALGGSGGNGALNGAV
ncbi:MAG: hypothetical protein N2378_10765 [Chloroflexaceae bacterium]|nr:hypothetical protein [Chloroflexaceae bacterium]